MFDVTYSKRFLREYTRLVKKTPQLEVRIEKALELLLKDPFDPALSSHKVTDSDGQPAFSIKVTGDIRVLWDYSMSQKKTIDLLRIGGHEGSGKVYS